MEPESRRTREGMDAEQYLRRMATVVRDSNDAITIQDFDGRITAWNRGAELMYGYSEAEALAANIDLLTAPGKIAEQQDFIRRLVAGEEITSFETQRVTKDGRVLDVWMTVTKLMDEAGNPVGLASTERDITARKRAEEALRESEEKYRRLIENSPELIYTINAEGVLTFVSSTWTTHLGHLVTQVTGQPFRSFVHPDDLASCQAFLETALKTGQCKSGIESRWHHADGSWRWHFQNGSPIRDQAGTVVGLQAITTDITERKRAENYREMGHEILRILNEPGDLQEAIQRVLAALKARTEVDAVGLRLQAGEDFPYFVQDGFSKDFLLPENTLLERGTDGGVCRDKDGNVSLECTCGLVISGKTDPSNPLFTKGGSCWTNDAFPLLDLPSDQDPRLHPRNNCIHQGYASVALIPIRGGDRIVGLIQLNDKRKGRFTLETIEILEGIAAHIGSALMRKRAEEERKTLQAQLRQAQKLESIGRLAGGVAHDFNNMLCIIIGRAEMALEKLGPADPTRRDLLEVVMASRRSADLTRQLLAFARRQVIAPKVLDLNDTVGGMLTMLQRLIGENIDLRWEPGANVWPVKMDPSQIDQIMANLVVNARDAIADVGKITIETEKAEIGAAYCATHADAAPGSYVMLAVSDDGHGMDQEVMAQIFEPFFTTKAVGQGTGLGLATVFGIVKQNQGFLDVHSNPGKGTTFKLYLPRHESAEALPAERQIIIATPTGTETILLVEDEQALLELATLQLVELGYTVLAADTPVKAIRLAKKHDGEIQLLMTDVIMPEMSGRELVKQINLQLPGIKCLYMSGYTADIIAEQGVLDEGIHFLQKPYSLATLAVKVRDALAGK